MQDASRRLNKIDEFQYPREILKLSVLQYNAKEIDETDLLISYLNLINMQTEFGNFKGAKKTLKHSKIFGLNSMNTSDVIKAVENEGYGTVFPWTNLINSIEVKHKEKFVSEFCKRNSSDHDSIELFEMKALLYWFISRMLTKEESRLI